LYDTTYFGPDERTHEMCNQYLMVDAAMELSCSSDGLSNHDCKSIEGSPYHPSKRWPLHSMGAPCPPPTPGNTSLCAVVQVSGVDIDSTTGAVYMFHRAGRTFWNKKIITDKTIMKLSSDGSVQAEWGAGLFITPHSITVYYDTTDGDEREPTLWLTDTALHQVIQLSLITGKVLGTLGVRQTPGAGRHHFNKPTDVAVSSNGTLYISDGYGNSRVVIYKKVPGRGYQYHHQFGSHGSDRGQFNIPHGVTLDALNRVYVADRQNGRIQVFSPVGELLQVWDPGVKDLQAEDPQRPWRGYVTSVDYDASLQVIFALVGAEVVMFDLYGNRVQRWGGIGSGVGEFNFPHAIAAGAGDTGHKKRTVYVAELDNQRLQQFVADG